jgi:chromosome segregation ATPase
MDNNNRMAAEQQESDTGIASKLQYIGDRILGVNAEIEILNTQITGMKTKLEAHNMQLVNKRTEIESFRSSSNDLNDLILLYEQLD